MLTTRCDFLAQLQRIDGLTEERMLRLVRMYHTARYAADATGCNLGSINRACRRYGLRFRHQHGDRREDV